MYRKLCKKKGGWGTRAQRKHIQNLCSMQEQTRLLVHLQCPINMMQANPNTYICTRNHYVRYSFQQSPHTGENQNHKFHNKSNTHPRHLGH
uniref:Uncharacterized protein n=1 Tax=Rhipicephalus zambeziensis TaxID=60191 RepID=A0A224YAH3_9ACAR